MILIFLYISHQQIWKELLAYEQFIFSQNTCLLLQLISFEGQARPQPTSGSISVKQGDTCISEWDSPTYWLKSRYQFL